MIVASLALLLLAQAKAPEAGIRVWRGTSGPRVSVRYSRPTFQWKIWPEDPARKVVAIQLALNGKVVPASYDSALRSVVYTPPQPLAVGTYRVECRVVFDRGGLIEEKWEATVASSPLTDLPPPDQAQREALAAVNRIRGRLGLSTVIMDDRLNMAAVMHTRYLAENRASGHHEDPAKPHYTGTTPSSRLEAFGYAGSSWEGVDFGSRNSTEAVRALFDAPLHRVPFLQPGGLPIGSGYLDQNFTLEFGEGGEEGTILSPANGESDIPTRWRNHEKPDPLAAFPSAPPLVGYPIVLARFGRKPKLESLTATLANPYGETVPCYFVPPSPARPGVSLLIPQAPLLSEATYVVSFVERQAGGQREYRSVFRTGKG